MLTLNIEKGEYLRVRKGMDGEKISAVFDCPVPNDVAEGQIIRLYAGCRSVFAAVGDDYGTIARRMGLDEGELARFNGGSPVYPTKRVWLPPEQKTR